MVELRLGKINNQERKFIPTKNTFLEEYLNNIQEIEEYELLQTYQNGYKYRRYNDHGIMKYTKNYKMDKISEVEEITEDEFETVLQHEKKYIRKTRKYYQDGMYEIDADYFLEPVSMIMIEVASEIAPLEEYQPPRGFIEVTNNKKYENLGIYHGSIIANHTILEGTDGVGKTVTIEKLLNEGIICQDRCMDMISKNMLFTISMESRTKLYQQYLKKINKEIIILVNNDQRELERRIKLRDHLSEFDKDTVAYNKLYLDTYLYMKEHNMLENKLFLVDCTNLSLEEQVNAVRKIILKKEKVNI